MRLLIFSYLLIYSLWAAAIDVPRRHDISDACRQFITSIQDQYEFGWVETPRFVYQDAGYQVYQSVEDLKKDERIFIFYYFQKKTERLKNPILFFNGGPGFSSHGLSEGIIRSAEKFNPTTQYDFIFMDQRGTGCSTLMPTGSSTESAKEIRSWSSFGIVQDAEFVRRHLIGDRKWKVLGQSYGAYAAYRYIEQFPSSLDKVFAHGNAVGISDFDRSLNRIYSQYRVQEAFIKKFPEARKRLTLFKMFLSDPTKCFRNTRREYCGHEISDPLVGSLGFAHLWPNLDQWLRTLVPTNSVSVEGVQAYVDRFMPASSVLYRDVKDPESFGDRLNISLHIFGLFDWDTKPLTYSICTKVYESILKKYKVKTDSLLINECQAPVQFQYEDKIQPFVHKIWPDMQTAFVNPQTVLQNIKSLKLSVYSYAGDLDCYVPIESFAIQNKLFGKSVIYTQFKTSGHEGYMSEKKIFDDMK